MAVIIPVEVNVINHQLPYYFDLLPRKGIDAVEGPLWVTGVRSHFGYYAVLF